jgi:hypothetical protein
VYKLGIFVYLTLFVRILLLENDESQYDTMRQQAVMHVCNNWDKFHEYVILTRDGYKSTMGQYGVYGIITFYFSLRYLISNVEKVLCCAEYSH